MYERTNPRPYTVINPLQDVPRFFKKKKFLHYRNVKSSKPNVAIYLGKPTPMSAKASKSKHHNNLLYTKNEKSM